MNEELVADLKQFITATITQQTAHLATKDDIANMATKHDIARIEQKIDDLQADVQHSVIDYVTIVDNQVQDHHRRLTLLEQ